MAGITYIVRDSEDDDEMTEALSLEGIRHALGSFATQKDAQAFADLWNAKYPEITVFTTEEADAEWETLRAHL
jgi:hypothetical protein